jgi:hypothetical protein
MRSSSSSLGRIEFDWTRRECRARIKSALQMNLKEDEHVEANCTTFRTETLPTTSNRMSCGSSKSAIGDPKNSNYPPVVKSNQCQRVFFVSGQLDRMEQLCLLTDHGGSQGKFAPHFTEGSVLRDFPIAVRKSLALTLVGLLSEKQDSLVTPSHVFWVLQVTGECFHFHPAEESEIILNVWNPFLRSDWKVIRLYKGWLLGQRRASSVTQCIDSVAQVQCSTRFLTP